MKLKKIASNLVNEINTINLNNRRDPDAARQLSVEKIKNSVPEQFASVDDFIDAINNEAEETADMDLFGAAQMMREYIEDV